MLRLNNMSSSIAVTKRWLVIYFTKIVKPHDVIFRLYHLSVLTKTIWFHDGLHPCHDDVFKWKHFPRYWPFVRGIHRSPVYSPHKGQWCGALTFSLICARINDWANNGDSGYLRRHLAHYDVIVMISFNNWLRKLTFIGGMESFTNMLWNICMGVPRTG